MITIDFNRLNLKPGDKILDIGCGEGRHTAKAWEFPEVFCVGADSSHKDLIASKEKLQLHEQYCISYLDSSNQVATKQGFGTNKLSSKSSLEVIHTHRSVNGSHWSLSAADITQLPFGDNSFDVVICSEVIEHIYEEQTALKELKRILKPDGYLALTVPRYLPEKICWILSREYCNTKGGHIRIYKKKELLDKMVSLGFQYKSSHYAHSLHTPFWWLKCMMGLNKNSLLTTLYHKMLVWDIMEKPPITRFIERLLNPVIGKSIALYFVKLPKKDEVHC